MFDRRRREELLTFPIAFAEHETSYASCGAGSETATSPGGDQRQAIHVERLFVSDRPLRVGHADRSHDAFAQEAAEVTVRAAFQRGGDRVAEHGHAGIAVLKTAAGREEQWSLVPRDREWIMRWGESFPEIAFPARQFLMGQPVLLRVGQTGSVRTQLADCDSRLHRVIGPCRDILARRVIQRDAPVAERNRDGNAPDQRLGHRGGEMFRGSAVSGGETFEDNFVIADDEQGCGAATFEVSPNRLQLTRDHPLAFR